MQGFLTHTKTFALPWTNVLSLATLSLSLFLCLFFFCPPPLIPGWLETYYVAQAGPTHGNLPLNHPSAFQVLGLQSGTAMAGFFLF